MLRSQLREPLARTRSIAQIALTVTSLAMCLRAIPAGDLERALDALPFAGLLSVLALTFLQTLLAGARWHHLLRHHRASAHPGITLRVMMLDRVAELSRFLPPPWQHSRTETYARWLDREPDAVQRAVLNDRLLQAGAAALLGCIGWALRPGSILPHPGPEAWLFGLLFLAAALLEWAGGWRAWSMLPARPGRDPREERAAAAYSILEQCMGGVALYVSLRLAGAGDVPWSHLMTAVCGARLAGLGSRFLEGWGVREWVMIAWLPIPALSPRVILCSGFTLLAAHGIWVVVAWVAAGREEGRRREISRPTPATVSIVLPALNEADGIAEAIRRAHLVPEVCEVILVDGGSEDATREVAEAEGCRVILAPPGRGGQMRAGAMQARGDVILFLHADTWLEGDAGFAVLECLRDPTVVAGAFWKSFRDTPALLLGSRPKCAVRLFLGRRIVGDMAMFVRRDVLEQIGGVPDMELMEDFELSKLLRQEGRLALADSTVTTSARRFREKGVIATYLKMWRIATLYRLGKSPAELRKLYG